MAYSKENNYCDLESEGFKSGYLNLECPLLGEKDETITILKNKKNQWFVISLQGWSKWRDHWASGKGLSMERTLVWIREGLEHWCTNKICHIHRPKQQLEGAGEFHVYVQTIPFPPQINV